jgi:hypothetical protein
VVEVISDAVCVITYVREDHPVGYGALVVDEVYGPFGWDDAEAFRRGLQLEPGMTGTQVLRNPVLSPHGVKPEDFRA